MTICERIFKLLDEKNLKAAHLAEYLGIRTSTTSTWKIKNTDPPARYLCRISEFLGITINELLESESEELPENDKELLKNFHMLPEREQIKWIARLEDAAAIYKQEKKPEQMQA